MTSTSGDWSPQFPLYRSKDLTHWQAAGAIFPHQPDWARGDFWAPELVSDGGRVLVYYVGRKRGGSLCVAVATAIRPAGPYTDHGAILCQSDGSIDPAFARDEHGKPYLVWKEDGNSEKRPTPIWAQPLSDDLFHLAGEKTQLIVNDPESWEGGVVEAPYVIRHGSSFYLLYAGNACCGTECKYAEGVARAQHLLGPWEKDPHNPIIRPNGAWKCPGHGSAVETPKGDSYFLYHAYPTKGTIYLGRESVLDKISWGADGWPLVNDAKGPSGGTSPPRLDTSLKSTLEADEFKATTLAADWQWPVNRRPQFTVGSGKFSLTVAADGGGDFVARSLNTSDYVAQVSVTTNREAMASLAVIGNPQHGTGLAAGSGPKGTRLQLWQQDEKGRHVLWQTDVAGTPALQLRVSSTNATNLAYSYSTNGKQWWPAGDKIDVTGLPQWDEGLRVGLMVNGDAGAIATFSHFRMLPALQ